MPLDTSADSPVPVRTVLQLVGGWISRLGRVWVEGQIAELVAIAEPTVGVIVNVGPTAGQTVFHLHWHILGGFA